MELERRRSREFQDGAREREKEYQKLKVRSLENLNIYVDVVQAQFDKLKRKALFAPAVGNENNPALMTNIVSNPVLEDQRSRPKAPPTVPNTRDISLVEINRVSSINASLKRSAKPIVFNYSLKEHLSSLAQTAGVFRATSQVRAIGRILANLDPDIVNLLAPLLPPF